jgi:hypothetical protein
LFSEQPWKDLEYFWVDHFCRDIASSVQSILVLLVNTSFTLHVYLVLFTRSSCDLSLYPLFCGLLNSYHLLCHNMAA